MRILFSTLCSTKCLNMQACQFSDIYKKKLVEFLNVKLFFLNFTFEKKKQSILESVKFEYFC